MQRLLVVTCLKVALFQCRDQLNTMVVVIVLPWTKITYNFETLCIVVIPIYWSMIWVMPICKLVVLWLFCILQWYMKISAFWSVNFNISNQVMDHVNFDEYFDCLYSICPKGHLKCFRTFQSWTCPISFLYIIHAINSKTRG